MTKYRITYWKHIPHPLLLKGMDARSKNNSRRISRTQSTHTPWQPVSTSTEEYAKQYKRGDWIEREGAPEEVAEALLSELEAEFAKIEIPKRNGSPVK